VKFCLLRARKSFIGMSTMAVVLTGLAVIDGAAAAQGNTAQQPATGQAGQTGQQGTPQKNYKDRGEYDLYSQITQTQDPKKRLDLLNQWQTKYPQSDFAQDRLQYFVATLGQLAANDPSVRQQLIDKCKDLLKLDPKNFTALYYIALWGPAVGGTNPSQELLSTTETAARGALEGADAAFPASKKPANMSEADWTKAKNQVLGIAHNALAWVATSRKDTATAENEYKESLTVNPDQGNVSYLYGKLLMDQKKYPEALFEFARAAQYDGPSAVPASARPQLMTYFNKVYSEFHGSPEGADKILAAAKTNALPPPDLKIVGAGDIAKQEADALQKRMDADPAFKLWYTIKTNLISPQGQSFFNSDVKDFEIPGGAQGVKNFTGTVISVDPPDRPTKVVLGVEDPTKPDATLTFSEPLPPNSVKVGDKLEFSGVADSYTADPYMLVFKDPTLPGVKTTTPKRAPARRRRPS
jgi:tetratricopeptide (TPR) repeat protein